MAWNPSPEVAVARDAAKKLNSPSVVVIYLSDDGENIGMASFGKTKKICAATGKLGDHLFDKAMAWNGWGAIHSAVDEAANPTTALPRRQ